MGRVFVGITGGSGHAYAQRLVQRLVEAGEGVDVALSGAGAKDDMFALRKPPPTT